MASTHAATFGEVILTTDLAVVLLLLAAAIAMFIAERPRMDMVAMIMIVAMPFTGIISINEALAGFSDSNIVLIAALFVIGEGLVRTGVARRLGDWLNASAGTSETRLLVLLMMVVGGLGALMSSTAVVAIFIPVVLRICGNTGTPPSRLMMPLSVAALVSGMLTLVATAQPVVNAELAGMAWKAFASSVSRRSVYRCWFSPSSTWCSREECWREADDSSARAVAPACKHGSINTDWPTASIVFATLNRRWWASASKAFPAGGGHQHCGNRP
jgi:di/tricarboxylate transporter